MTPLTITPHGACEIRMTRGFAAPMAAVYQALIDPRLVRQWLLGPAGWSFHLCEIDARPGGRYHYVWDGPGGQRMGLGGRYLELAPPDRLVHTETFDGMEEHGEAMVTTTLEQQAGETILRMTIVYPTQKMRDGMIAAPMEKGVSASYNRLDQVLTTGVGI